MPTRSLTQILQNIEGLDCAGGDTVHYFTFKGKTNKLNSVSHYLQSMGSSAITLSHSLHWGNIDVDQTTPTTSLSGQTLSRRFYFQNPGYTNIAGYVRFRLHDFEINGSTDYGSYLRIDHVGHSATVTQLGEWSTDPSSYAVVPTATEVSHGALYGVNIASTDISTDSITAGETEWQYIKVTIGTGNDSANWLQNDTTNPLYSVIDYDGRTDSNYIYQQFYGLHSMHLSGFKNC